MDEKFKSDFKELMKDVKFIKTKVNKTEKSMQAILLQLKNLKEENKMLKSKVQNLDYQNQKLRSAVNDVEQYSRKDNVIINGVPYNNEENIVGVVDSLAASLGVTLNDYDICSAHRLPAHGDNIPAIIVRLNSRLKKAALIENSRKKETSRQRPKIRSSGADFCQRAFNKPYCIHP